MTTWRRFLQGKPVFLGFLFSILTVLSVQAQTTKTYEYDELSRVLKVEDDADDKQVSYEYDAAGNRTRVSNAAVFSVADSSASEGGAVTFTITRAAVEHTAVSVDYATSSGTATSGTDFTAASGTLNFAIDETSKTVNISTTNDSTYEENENFTLTLSNSSAGAIILGAQAVGVINNNDSGPVFSINNVAVSEGGTLTFTITKSDTTAEAHTVDYSTASGTATSGTDFTAASGTKTFASGQTTQTVTVTTTQDTTYESNEELYVNLSNPTNSASISVNQGVGVGTINNDDPYVVYVRDNSGALQPGFTQSINYSSHVGWIWRTKVGASIIHMAVTANEFDNGYCNQTFAPATGYSFTGNGCELRVD